MILETKIGLLMKNLTLFYKEEKYIKELTNIINQNSIISLRILDWFITNYSKKYKTIIRFEDSSGNLKNLDVYLNYKLMLKSFSKKSFDPFCRKNKIIFYYDKKNYIETSCGQLCFFKWCFENNILEYVKNNLSIIENDMKNSLNIKKQEQLLNKKRQPLSITSNRCISKTYMKYVITFD